MECVGNLHHRVIWRIYYRHSTIDGESFEEWRDTPNQGVQVVVSLAPGHRSGWSYEDQNGRRVAVSGRKLWTGQDEYDPFGWGVKYGSLIPDEEYWLIWRRACTESLAT